MLLEHKLMYFEKNADRLDADRKLRNVQQGNIRLWFHNEEDADNAYDKGQFLFLGGN